MTDRREDATGGDGADYDDRADYTPVGVAGPSPEEDLEGLEDLLGYEDDDVYVICDRSNPNAWIESERVEDLRS